MTHGFRSIEAFIALGLLKLSGICQLLTQKTYVN